jgi:hypothetical protein
MPEVYSLREVAEKLGMAPQTLEHHIYMSGLYAGYGRDIGHSMAFSQRELDEMVAKRPDRPRSGEPEKMVDGVSIYELAYRLREEGKSYDAIAAALGYKTRS